MICTWQDLHDTCDIVLSLLEDYGYQVMVAKSRYMQPVANSDLSGVKDNTEMRLVYSKYMESIRNNVRIPLENKHAGQIYYAQTEKELFTLLLNLRTDGIVYPNEILVGLSKQINF